MGNLSLPPTSSSFLLPGSPSSLNRLFFTHTFLKGEIRESVFGRKETKKGKQTSLAYNWWEWNPGWFSSEEERGGNDFYSKIITPSFPPFFSLTQLTTALSFPNDNAKELPKRKGREKTEHKHPLSDSPFVRRRHEQISQTISKTQIVKGEGKERLSLSLSLLLSFSLNHVPIIFVFLCTKEKRPPPHPLLLSPFPNNCGLYPVNG